MIPELPVCIHENRGNLVIFISNFISQYNIVSLLDFTKEHTTTSAIDAMLKEHKDIALKMFYAKYCCYYLSTIHQSQNNDNESINAIEETRMLLNNAP